MSHMILATEYRPWDTLTVHRVQHTRGTQCHCCFVDPINIFIRNTPWYDTEETLIMRNVIQSLEKISVYCMHGMITCISSMEHIVEIVVISAQMNKSDMNVNIITLIPSSNISLLINNISAAYHLSIRLYIIIFQPTAILIISFAHFIAYYT